ncbi:HIT domain-containing protein [Candidatus Woesearchaeota archaeon]|nr:HIT domain-containing protein [Candidatus Woesearchaeota archaeon]
MNDKCLLCKELETKKSIIYEDDTVAVIMGPAPAAPGHVIVVPKKHYPIIEQIPDEEFGKIFNIVNKVSTAIFESVEATGTNIIVQNGVAAGQLIPHSFIHVIPRKDDDNIDFQWQPKQIAPEQFSKVEANLKKAAESIEIGKKKEKKKEPVKAKKEPEKMKATKQENYMIKQLERIP